MSRVLVVTSVHPPDDPRIRYKTIPAIQAVAAVRYAASAPGPINKTGLDWRPLEGSRSQRWLMALREMIRPDVDLVSVHDPELIPAALLARRIRGIPRTRGIRRLEVVFDVHEDLLARVDQISWVPGRWRRPVRWLAHRSLWLVERSVTLTLAEQGYSRTWRHPHPVFPNFPVGPALPSPGPAAADRPIVYVGDITEARGAVLLIKAVARAGLDNPVVLIGRCQPELSARLTALAERVGVTVDLTGFLPHADAMVRVAGAAIGVCPLQDLPNYRWSLPTKVMEYLTLGVPVVASNLPGTAQHIAGLPGVVLVAAADVDALSDGIRIALDDACRLAAAHNADDVRDAFRWPADQVSALYKSVLGDA